ncbi:MAG: OmpH family outer membrane protein [Prevotella sp.]|nr:OmpH family outer membrane protein [Prevotella sp.]
MKKSLFVAMAAVCALASCNNQAPKMDEKAQAAAPAELKIAYVEMDSIQTQYKFCKDMEPTLEKRAQNSRNTLAQKQQSLQTAAAKFQQDLQNNKYTQAQAEQVNAGLQKQNSDLQALAQRLDTELATEQQNYLQAVNDSIQHFLEQYNKSKKYAFIVTKAGLLYADHAYDITAEVVAGLNKSYKGLSAKPAAAAAKKDEKK